MRVSEASAEATLSGPSSRLVATADGWDRFWFGSISSSVVALYRTLLGLVNLYWFVTLLPDVNWFFGDQSVDPVATYGSGRWGLFRWLDAEILIWPVLLLSIVASTALILGRAVIPAAVWLAVVLLSLYNDNAYLWNSGDDLLRILNVLFAVAAVVLPVGSMDRPLLPSDGVWARVPAFGMRLAQIQLTAIYLTTVIDKIPGDSWREGWAVGSALKIENLARFPVPDFLIENPIAVNLLTWSSLALEFSLPFLLWNRATRRFAIVAGVLLHLGIEYSLIVGVFSWCMFVLYSAFLDGDRLETRLHWLAGRLGRATTDVESGATGRPGPLDEQSPQGAEAAESSSGEPADQEAAEEAQRSHSR